MSMNSSANLPLILMQRFEAEANKLLRKAIELMNPPSKMDLFSVTDKLIWRLLTNLKRLKDELTTIYYWERAKAGLVSKKEEKESEINRSPVLDYMPDMRDSMSL